MNLDGLFARSERILKTRNQQEVNKAAREAAKLREVARREAEAAGIVLDDDELDVLEDDEYSDDYEDPLATDDEDDAGEKGSGAKAGPKQLSAEQTPFDSKPARVKRKQAKPAEIKKKVYRRVSYASETPQDIHDIVRIQDANLRPTANSVLNGLEQEVRKGAREAKKTFDTTKFVLEQRRAELSSIIDQIAESSHVARALGYHDVLDDQERLEIVEAVSRKQMYLAGTAVSDIEAEIAGKVKQTEKIKEDGKVFSFMLQRLKAEQANRHKLIKQLKCDLHAANLQLQKVQRQGQMRKSELMKAKGAYEKLSAEVMEKLSLWDKEIADRQTFQQEKEKFTEFYLAEVIQKRELVEQLQSNATKKEQGQKGGFAQAAVSLNAREKAKSLLRAKIEARRKRKKAAEAQKEEKAFKYAFVQLGLTRTDVLGPLETDVDAPPISESKLHESLVSKVRTCVTQVDMPTVLAGYVPRIFPSMAECVRDTPFAY